MAEVARRYRLEVSKTLGAPVAISAITKANPAAVTTGAAHGLDTGDFALLSVQGMFEIDNLAPRVTTVDATGLTLDGLNATAFSDFDSGSVIPIIDWLTVGNATGIDFGSASVDNLEATTLLSQTRQYEAGLPDQPSVTVNMFSDYAQEAESLIEEAALNNRVLVFRATRASGQRTIFVGVPSTIGENVQSNQLITGSFSVAMKSPRRLKYAA